MASKKQELEVLEKIRKMVDELGDIDDSYLGITFEGIFEIAKLNIENDWGCNPVEAQESSRRQAEEAQEKLKAEMCEHNETKRHLAHLTAQHEELRANLTNYRNNLSETVAANEALIDKVNRLREEIVHLKARLYDEITKGEDHDKTQKLEVGGR
jgi:DNA repair exonuclease SbcCD ATPase subunit